MARNLALGATAIALVLAAFWLWGREPAAPQAPPGSELGQQAADPAHATGGGPASAQDPRAQDGPTRERATQPGPAPYLVRGAVLADQRAPDLSRARVIAYAGAASDEAGFFSSAMNTMAARDQRPAFLLEGEPIAEAAIAADGSFALQVAQPHLRLAIDDDLYLLAAPEVVHVSERTRTADVVLSPLLGGMLRGRLVGARADGVEELQLTLEPDPMAILRDGRSMMAAVLSATRPSARPRDDRTFLFRAVCPGARIELTAQGSGATGRSTEPPLQAGEVRDVILPVGPAATLAVEVVDERGDPIAGASVMVRAESGGAMATAVRSEHERTDDAGRCRFDALHPGAYSIVGSAPDRTTARARVDARAAPEPVHVRLTLTEGGVVTGVVVDPDDQPLADAHVAHHPGEDIPLLGDIASQLGPNYLDAIARSGTRTDEQGRFRLAGISDQNPFLVVGAHDAFAAGAARDVEIGDADVVVRLQPQGGLRARVVGADTDAPVPHFVATVTRTSFVVMQMPVRRAVVHDDDGALAIDKLPFDSYTLRIEADGYGASSSDVKVAAAAPHDLGTITLQPAARIRGVVQDEDGRPIRGAMVRKRRGGMADNPILAMFDAGSAQAYSDADGRFDLGPLQPGRMMLTASADGYASGRSARVEVAAGEALDGVVIELGHGGSIRGRIVCGAGQQPSDFLLLAQHQVSQNTHSADLAPGGEFLIENLDPGAYAVQAMPRALMESFDGSDWRPGEGLDIGELMRAMTDNVVSERCAVRAGEEVAVTLEVADIAVGRQWTVLVQVGGARAGSGAVEAVSLDDGTMRVAMLVDGRATFGRMQPGVHRLQVRSGLTMTPVGDPQELAFPEGRDQHTSTLALPGGELRGRVVDARTDAPLRMVVVHLHHDGEGERDDPIGLCLTDDDGAFTFAGLEDGTYSLVAAQPMAGDDDTASRRSGVAVVGGTTGAPVVLRAQPAAGAAVLVVDEAGQPVRGATVLCVDEQGRPLGSLGIASTGPDGRAFFGGMARGAARIVGRAPGYAPGASAVLQLAPEHQTEFTLTLADGAPTRLTVVDTQGRALRGATVTARFEGSPWLPTMLLVQRVQADGAFELGRLGAGAWTFRVSHPSIGTVTRERTIRGAAPVTIVVSEQ